jgi:uncharacterized YccA/Bax inhibitor family protein
MMRSGNPALSDAAFSIPAPGTERMTVNGTVRKTAGLLVLVLLTSIWTWSRFMQTGDPASVQPYILGGAIGGLIVAMITIFKKNFAPITAPVYALLEGLAIGGLSAIFEAQFPGIVLQAVALTFGTLACLLIAYRSGLIRATENFKLGVVAATGGIALIYLASIALSFFGIRFPFIHEGGPIGILFSLFVVTIAALNLVLDFDFIEKASERETPKYMEWYGAFGLIVTLIWLYLEILRLLAKSRR